MVKTSECSLSYYKFYKNSGKTLEKRSIMQHAAGAICIGVDAFLTIPLMDGSRSFTNASIESLKNDLAHHLAHSRREYIDVTMLHYIGCIKSGALL